MDKETTDYKTYYYYHHRSGFGALVLIFIGFVFLLNNFGILPWQIWGNLWRFWPLLLILAGFHMIFGRSRASSLIFFILGLILIAIVLLISLAPANPQIKSFIDRYLPGISVDSSHNSTDWQEIDQNNNLY